ncbi:hypothetical protein PMI30_03093 [Pseudomonas sp. GM50]|uniref:Tc toxin subunit A-related protein n=1 Tax=Pseudomonas sp. GM50 TaxID=1144332 RepID=UPI000270C785|nr:neuraminidase-like domain-containing protein [Pseudomonas sp. GM50]EJM65725.1 hypothetical protein PMI30_03093 [Pseudomonas sp. GM50]
MTTAIEKQLNEARRDALLAMYLHEAVPNDPTLIDLELSHQLETANDIYEYLLLDVLVSQDVPTSPVACAIASMQQYIHGVLLGLEPEQSAASLSEEQRRTWRLESNQYALWAAVQQLHYFPSIYMDPTLRLTKTDSFEQFENDINQNRIQPETVQTAVLAYLARFEEIANVRCVNGYIDGEKFANNVYYFIGKSPAENTWYWRTLDMANRPVVGPARDPQDPPLKYDKPLPDAWSDWKRANVPISTKAIEHSVRPVWFNKRLFVFWAEVTTTDENAMPPSPPPADGQPALPNSKANPMFRLYGAYKKYDDTWSTPQVYIESYSTTAQTREMDPNLLEQGTDTIAVWDHSTTPESLFLALYADYHAGTGSENGGNDSYGFLRTVRIDMNFNKTPMFPAVGYVEAPKKAITNIEEGHVRMVCHLFAHEATGRSRFQYWLPTGRQEFGTVTPSSPGDTANTWNYKGWQNRIRNEIDSVRYSREDSAIYIDSRLEHGFPHTTTISISMKAQGTVLLKLTLVVDSSSTANWLNLLEGSTIEATGTDFFNQGRDFYFTEAEPRTLNRLIVELDAKSEFELPKLAQGETTALVNKRMHKDVLALLLQNHSPMYPKKILAFKRTLKLDSMDITGIDGPYYFQHVILHPRNVTEVPKTPAEMLEMYQGSIAPSIDKDDILSTRIPIDQENLRPDTWPVEWPTGHVSIPLIHGVFVHRLVFQEGRFGYAYQGSALKMISVGWRETPDVTPQTAPRIDHLESPTLGTAEFIDFYGSSIQHNDITKNSETKIDRAPIRMNTTFARNLIHRAEAGMDELLSWGTQKLEEPPMSPDLGAEPMDFTGAYYLYFLELFLYLPWLVAHRLNLEQQFDEAERWLGYAFDPMRQKSKKGNPPYWNVVPIAPEKATQGSAEPSHAALWPNDPHQIGLSHPVHIRKALFLLSTDIKLNRADHAYMQLTPDSLTEAKLHYVHVLDQLGPRPDVSQVNTWQPITLKTLSDATNPELRRFEQNLLNPQQLVLDHPLPTFGGAHTNIVPYVCLRPYAEDPSLPTVDNPHLRLPFNPELIMRWDHAESRLYNLRHNLDPAGKPLHLPLFATPLDPRALLAAYGQGLSGSNLGQFLNPDIPPYRFSVMYPYALNAVEQVIQFGSTLQSLIERKEQTQLLEMQQQQAWTLAQSSLDVQVQALEIDKTNKTALLASRSVVQGRLEYYSKRVEEYMSLTELAASSLPLMAKVLTGTAAAARAYGEAMKTSPNVGGVFTAVGLGFISGVLFGGGQRLEGTQEAAGTWSSNLADAANKGSQSLFMTASFQNRHMEWKQAMDQATRETAQIDAQLDVWTAQHKATSLQVTYARNTLNQSKKTYEFLTSSDRFSKSQTYDWLISQLAGFYFNAYSSALSLCQNAEACWRYEEADYHRPPAFTGASWNGNYRGLGAGESLKQGLLGLQTQHLLQDERDLEISKTVSLQALKAMEPTSTLNKDWTGIKLDLENGSCEFELTQAMFDDDYPGHYLRRIKSISVSLPGLLGPYQNICAILSQTYSRVEMSSVVGATPKDNLRASQRIALSTGHDDAGLFMLNFQDERYLPFEYTGAVSKWYLQFPNHNKQLEMIKSLTDIILHVRYTAVSGGSQ